MLADPFMKRLKLVHNGGFPKYEVIVTDLQFQQALMAQKTIQNTVKPIKIQ